MSGFIVYTANDSLYVEKRYATVGAAKAAMTRTKKRDGSPKYPATTHEVMSLEQFQEADVLVETYNMLNPKGGKVMIRKSQKGSCCDPATERYHCM
jgi:hypothetical protein